VQKQALEERCTLLLGMALIGQEKSTVRGAIALVQDNDTFSGFLNDFSYFFPVLSSIDFLLKSSLV
jgi:hypothetical protein